MSAAVQFLTNEKGKKTAVVLPIQDYEKLQEDLDDLAVIAERRDEETIPHAEFKKGFKRNGLSH
jgi:PHD/YefM family antitoxin component YafN of YafNO toxin-antitoxin module